MLTNIGLKNIYVSRSLKWKKILMTRMRGNWPVDHPATCLLWQGANASPLTGSMRGI